MASSYPDNTAQYSHGIPTSIEMLAKRTPVFTWHPSQYIEHIYSYSTKPATLVSFRHPSHSPFIKQINQHYFSKQKGATSSAASKIWNTAQALTKLPMCAQPSLQERSQKSYHDNLTRTEPCFRSRIIESQFSNTLLSLNMWCRTDLLEISSKETYSVSA